MTMLKRCADIVLRDSRGRLEVSLKSLLDYSLWDYCLRLVFGLVQCLVDTNLCWLFGD